MIGRCSSFKLQTLSDLQPASESNIRPANDLDSLLLLSPCAFARWGGHHWEEETRKREAVFQSFLSFLNLTLKLFSTIKTFFNHIFKCFFTFMRKTETQKSNSELR